MGTDGNEMKYVLAIDAGTQSIRSVLVDTRGELHDRVKTPIEPYFSKHPGWAEQDPEYYWRVLCETCRVMFEKTSIPCNAIKGVAVTTQRATVINLDREGNPLRPAITWLDQRKAQLGDWPPAALSYILKAIGMWDTVEFAVKECESNWIRQNQPEIWEKTHKYVFLSGFFHHRLTGKYVESIGNSIGYVPFDYKRQQWAKDTDFKWKLFPIEKNKLPALVEPVTIIGNITAKAAGETGIPEGLPVVAAAADKACEVLASGCISPETACLSFGTTATVCTTTKKYVEIVPNFPPYPSAIPGYYNTEVQIFRGFWMISWFKEEFGLQETLAADEKNVAAEALFDDLIKDIPPGSMGLVLQPFWTGGLKSPGPEAKGAIIGFGDVHKRAHLYRAILEGLAYSLKEGLAKTEKRSGTKVKTLRVSGGGSQSNEAMQITADVFGMRAERPRTYETSALGAAIVASVGLGLHPDFETAIAQMTGTGDVFDPIPDNVRIYEQLFEKVYQKMYPALHGIYNDIRDITGYPPK